LHLHASVKRLVEALARQDVLQRRPDESTALAWLDVLEVHDGPELAVEVEHQSVLEVVRGGHSRGLSPEGLSCGYVMARPHGLDWSASMPRSDGDELLRRHGEQLRCSWTHNQSVFDANTTALRQIH